jgi:steroid 5-alpha reductase family enzyme
MGVVSSGGLFEYVSGANYTAEILEWAGFALASWSLPAAVFAAFTALNIGEANTHMHL